MCTRSSLIPRRFVILDLVSSNTVREIRIRISPAGKVAKTQMNIQEHAQRQSNTLEQGS